MVAFRTLGGLTVSDENGELSIGGPRQRRLLAMLVINRNRVVSTDRLADVVFDGEPTPAAATTLRSYIARVRRVVDTNGEPPRVRTQAPGYQLDLPDDLLDAARFDRLVSDARTVAVTDAHGAVELLHRALSLWRGRPYAEFADEEWARAEVQRLDELRLAAHELLGETLLGSGRPAEVVQAIEPLASEHPLREAFQTQLMLALYRTGRQADALRVYQDHRRALVDELGLDPTPTIQQLEQRLLAQDPGLLDPQPQERWLRAYRLGARLAAGHDSTTYVARLPGIERDLVVKAFRREVADDPAFVRTFEATAQRVAALRHPAIGGVQDCWREPGAAYVVSPWLPGGSLADRLHRGTMPMGEVTQLVRRIGGALLAADAIGVVHGAVTAHNVLYDAAGDPVLVDFGVGQPGRSRVAADDRRDFVTMLRTCVPGLAPGTGYVDAPLEQVVGDLLAVLEATDPGPTGLPNPYKGLRAFDEVDAGEFFGRDDLIDEIIDRLDGDGVRSRLVLVVGGSGTGKSSLVRAGVVPRVRRGDVIGSGGWYVTTMLPGPAPFTELGESLRRIGTAQGAIDPEALAAAETGLDAALRATVPAGHEVLVVIDQFEELFTLASETEQHAFLDSLVHALTAPESRLRVIATLRADFFDRPLATHRFGALVSDVTVTVPAMSPSSLEAAIVAPAERVGRGVEGPLVAELVAAVADEPAALPALQFMLFELAEACSGVLTAAACRKLGGITGAIATRAEVLHAELDHGDRAVLRHMFEQLVVVASDGEPTRRAAPRTELTGNPGDPRADALLDRWIDARLLTADRHPHSRVPTIEVAHEALLREWPRLGEWIDEDRGALVVLDHLRHAAAGWHELDRDPGALYRGARLQVALDVASTRPSLPAAEHEFLDASRVVRDEEIEAAAADATRQARTNRRLKVQLGIIGAALVVALAGGFLAVDQRQGAERERRVATARELASASTANLSADPDRSTLLALAALDTTLRHGEPAIPEAVQALHSAVSSHRLVLDVPGVGGALDWSPAGDVFVTEGTEESGIIDIRDASTGESLHAFTGHDPDVNDVKFNADGSLLATTGDDGALRIWDPATGTAVRAFEYEPGVSVWAPSFSPDGAMVVAAWFAEDGPIFRLFDVATGALLTEQPGPAGLATSFSPDGSRLAIADNGAEEVLVVAPLTGEVVLTIPSGQLFVKDVAFSPDGRWLATTGGDSTVKLWAAGTGKIAMTITAHEGSVNSVDWSADGRLLATAGLDGSAKVIEIADGTWREVASVSAESLNGGVADVAFSPDATRIMTGDFSVESTKVWEIDPTAGGEVFNVMSAPFVPNPVVWTDDDRIVASAPGGMLSVWSGTDGRLLDTIGPLVADGDEVTKFAVSPDGALVATTNAFLPIDVWDLTTGDRVGVIGADEGGFVYDLSWDATGERLAVALGVEVAGEVVVTDRTGAELRRFVAEPDVYVRSVRFDPGGERLYASLLHLRDDPAKQGTRVWDLATGDIVQTLDAPSAGVAVDPTGRHVATVQSLDGVADVWDAATGAHVSTLTGPAVPEDVQFSPDGRHVATSAHDGTVRIWDPATGRQQVVLTHDDQVSSSAFSPDGTRIASLTYDGVIRVWTLDLDELVDIARRRVTRDLIDAECRQYLHVDSCADR